MGRQKSTGKCHQEEMGFSSCFWHVCEVRQRGHLPSWYLLCWLHRCPIPDGSSFAAQELFCSLPWRRAPSDVRWFGWVSVPQKMCGLSSACCTDVGWMACLSMRGCPRSVAWLHNSSLVCFFLFFFLAVRRCLCA